MSKLAQLLLPPRSRSRPQERGGVTPRRQSRGYITLRTSIDQAKPVSATQLEPEDALDVAMALHYKALSRCRAARIPRLEWQPDYSRWRTSRSRKALAQLEAVAGISAAAGRCQGRLFEQARAATQRRRAPAADAGALHRICEVALVDQFRTGTPVPEAGTGAAPPVGIIQPSPVAVTTSVTVHKKSAPPADPPAALASPPVGTVT